VARRAFRNGDRGNLDPGNVAARWGGSLGIVEPPVGPIGVVRQAGFAGDQVAGVEHRLVFAEGRLTEGPTETMRRVHAAASSSTMAWGRGPHAVLEAPVT
jgi:hypothetical protein